ncbi:MAG: DUF222 domain-containing protein [Terrimesophilobacter sp.]
MQTSVEAFMTTAQAVADYAHATSAANTPIDAVPACAGAPLTGLSDAGLVGLQKAIAVHERHVDALKTQAAGELARRSRRELGHAGLAAREGFRSPEAMLQSITGATGREAAQLVALGRIAGDADAAQQLLDDGVADIGGEPVVLPWETPITAALASGVLSAEQADALRRGLGTPDERITADQLRDAATELVTGQAGLSADRLYREAHIARDLIDEAGIPAREAELYELRSLRLRKLGNGMVHATWDLDPEGGSWLTTIIDPLTSPRRGGPRMVDPAEIERARKITDDPRSNEQIASDGLLQLLHAGVNADPTKMFGKILPQVKIVVTQSDLESGTGFGVIQGNPAPVSVTTAKRMACMGGTQTIFTTPTGGPLDLGRTRRLFDDRQHEALAIRDGGCVWPDCENAPVMTEAHHIDEYKKDHGKTDIADGVCLCRFHHLTLHNNGWRIIREGSNYWLIPPPRLDPDQTPIALHTKSLLMRKLQQNAS